MHAPQCEKITTVRYGFLAPVNRFYFNLVISCIFGMYTNFLFKSALRLMEKKSPKMFDINCRQNIYQYKRILLNNPKKIMGLHNCECCIKSNKVAGLISILLIILIHKATYLLQIIIQLAFQHVMHLTNELHHFLFHDVCCDCCSFLILAIFCFENL